MNKETRLHFVGIGGIGMSGIAEVLRIQGHEISGSDISDSETLRRLETLGATIHRSHSAGNVAGAGVVVVSSAVRPDNPEVVEARRLRIPVIPRAEMLGELMRGKTGIAVAGSHGKTTTTSMIASILAEARMDPTVVVGGIVDAIGSNAKHGQGAAVVAEADESDGSFQYLPATYAVVTNIDNDHLDYFGSLGALEDAFTSFVGKIPFYGAAVVCGDDPGVRRCLSRFTKPYLTYGFGEESDFSARELALERMGSCFRVVARNSLGERTLGEIRLQVPGRHNALNALGAVAAARALEIPFETIASALAAFRGVKRRFELKWENPGRKIAIVEDYGHHPAEVAATLSAARRYWEGRIVVLFQPHRFSRTRLCHDGFLRAFADADVVLISDIYPAGEEPLPGVSSSFLARDLVACARAGQEFRATGSLAESIDAASKLCRDGDLLLCLGAGSVTRAPAELARILGETLGR